MSLTSQDQKIRRNWLITYSGCFVYSLILMFIIYLKNAPQVNIKYTVVALASMFIAFFATSYLLYRCAYRKPGTKFLTVVIILGMLNFFYTLYIPFSGIPLPLPLSIHLISMVLSCVLIYFHCRLWQVNRRFKACGN